MQIDRSNYELWLIDWLDGNLDEVRIKQLQFFLNENPDLKTEAEKILPAPVEKKTEPTP